MNKIIVVVFILAVLLFVLGLFVSLKQENGGAIIISASILLASIFICLKIEEIQKR